IRMLIRNARIEESEQLCTLLEDVDAFHASARPDVYRQPQPALRTTAFIESGLANPEQALFVAERDSQILGTAWVIIRGAPDRPIFVPRWFVIVEILVVSEWARRSGVGRALMHHIHHWATERELREVQLTLHEFNLGAR